MNLRKPLITSLISMSTIAPGIAQKTTHFASEAGVSGIVNKDASFYSGLNLILSRGKTFTDFYAGIGVQPDKKVSFQGLAIYDYSWTKNISSWAREFFSISENVNSIFEVAPIKINANAGRFNFAFCPSYAIYNDTKGIKNSVSSTQGFNPIFQITYSGSPKHSIFLEAKYSTEPQNNLFKTHFGRIKNNISYMCSSLWKF